VKFIKTGGGMEKKNFPANIVNMGSVVSTTPEIASVDYYREFDLSISTSETLARHNKNGYPIDEFYWLDQKWWDFFTGKSKRVIEEVRELVGGAFIKLSLTGQCSLLDIPFYSALSAPADVTLRKKNKWIFNKDLVAPEEYVLKLISGEYEIILADEGEHIKVWLLNRPGFRGGLNS
jgi:hypothetical protein